MRKQFISIVLLVAITFCNSVNAQKTSINRNIKNYSYVEKGTWITGGQFSFNTKDYDDYKLSVLNGWKGTSYNFKVSPYVLYIFKENTGVGMKFSYARSENDLNNLSLQLDDDLTLTIDDAYDISHTFYATAFLRNYLGLGEDSRFALFVDTELSYGYGQGKTTSGTD